MQIAVQAEGVFAEDECMDAEAKTVVGALVLRSLSPFVLFILLLLQVVSACGP